MRSSPGCWILTNSVRPSGAIVAPVTSALTGDTRKRRTSPVRGSAASMALLPTRSRGGRPMAEADRSVWIHSTPRASAIKPSGQPKLSPPKLVGSPASTKWFQVKVVASKSPDSLQRMMCPAALRARGLAASTPGRPGSPRCVLLVSEQYTQPSGCTAVHSGRSMRVPPTRSQARRVLIRNAPSSAKPPAAVSGPWPCTSASHWPRPSASKRATYNVP